MAKNRTLIKNSAYNFKLSSRSCFFIVSYFILGTLLIKTVISGFIAVNSPFSFLTVNFLEYFIFSISFLVFLFSILSLFFDSRRKARKTGTKVWNQYSKKMMWILYLLLISFYGCAFYLLRIGEEIFIIPAFIIGYGILLLILNFSKKIQLYQFSIACFLIGFIPLFVDGFGFYSLTILGIAHYIFSFTTKTSNDI